MSLSAPTALEHCKFVLCLYVHTIAIYHTEVAFLGLSEAGLRPDSDNIAVLFIQIPQPEPLKQLCSVNGILTWYGPFLPHLLAVPLLDETQRSEPGLLLE